METSATIQNLISTTLCGKVCNLNDIEKIVNKKMGQVDGEIMAIRE